MPESDDYGRRHFTLRHGFTIFIGFLVLALYFVWAFYGAAPTSLSFLTEAQAERPSGASPGGHGAMVGKMTPEAFEELAYKFVDDFGLPDGSVRPGRLPLAAEAAMGGGHYDGEAAADDNHDAAETTEHGVPMASRDDHGDSATEDDGHGRTADAGGAGHGPADTASRDEPDEVAHGGSDRDPREMVSMAQAAVVHSDDDAHGDDEDAHAAAGERSPIDVYMMALQYSYVPNVLRLQRNVPYRFRMMSMDVNHGASIHSGFAGHIMRRPAQSMVEMVMTFPEPGDYMVYCTVYCGEGHSTMKGKIIVE